MGSNEFLRPTKQQMSMLLMLVGTSIKNFFPLYGVLCLTPDSSNIPMWAHYGYYHQGYCVIFEMDLDYIYDLCKKTFQVERSLMNTLIM